MSTLLSRSRLLSRSTLLISVVSFKQIILVKASHTHVLMEGVRFLCIALLIPLKKMNYLSFRGKM